MNVASSNFHLQDIAEYQQATDLMYSINTVGIRLKQLHIVKTIGYIKKGIHEKVLSARKKWEDGRRNPDPYVGHIEQTLWTVELPINRLLRMR